VIAEACDRRGVRTLVLNGDVLELALASEESAFRSARALFADLNRVRGLERVVVILGNHDHRLFEYIPTRCRRSSGANTRKERASTGRSSRSRPSARHGRLSRLDRAGARRDGPLHARALLDRVVTPEFAAPASIAEVEEANQEWWSDAERRRRNSTVRSIYRSAYHFGHHVKGLVDAAEEKPRRRTSTSCRRASRRACRPTSNSSRIRVWSRWSPATRIPKAAASRPVLLHGREVGVFDPGAFVVAHHNKKPRPHIFFLDTRTGEMRLEAIHIPKDVMDATRERAFEAVP